jgi:hypothetical protein
MGLVNKVKASKKEEDEALTKQESEFILTKLRSATYKGEEFEMFYKVYRKIAKHIDSLK